MVLFGVLAALLVDQWRENHQIQREIAAATLSLDREVEHNLREIAELDSVVDFRLGRLGTLDPSADPGSSLADLRGAFTGFRSPSLAQAAWTRISTGQLGDHMPADLMTAAFELYSWNAHLVSLDDEIQRLVDSETFHDPARTSLAIAISKEIMQQQIAWCEQAIPHFEAFLETYGGPQP